MGVQGGHLDQGDQYLNVFILRPISISWTESSITRPTSPIFLFDLVMGPPVPPVCWYFDTGAPSNLIHWPGIISFYVSFCDRIY